MWAIQDRVTDDIKNASLNMGSIAFRVLLWQSAWQMFLDNPVLGIGFDNFVLHNVSTAYFPFLKALGGEGLYVHNVYLQILVEMGLIGFLAFLNLLRVVYTKLLRITRTVRDDDYLYVVLGYGGALALWLFMSLTEASIYTPVTAAFFFFYLGMISGFNKILIKENKISER